MRLLQELQEGGTQATFEEPFKRFGSCTLFWKDEKIINPRDVTFDELVAPLGVIVARGSSDRGTTGRILNYRLSGHCTNIFVISG